MGINQIEIGGTLMRGEDRRKTRRVRFRRRT
jgi:hypothetical protein